MNIRCPYCGKTPCLVTGDTIYPHRPDLVEKNFWFCRPCDAYVGCHEANPRFGFTGIEPLGRLADKELRMAKSDAHTVFDPLWKGERKIFNRTQAYAWLAVAMGKEPEQTHIGMFDVAECKAVVTAVKNLRRQLETNPQNHARQPAPRADQRGGKDRKRDPAAKQRREPNRGAKAGKAADGVGQIQLPLGDL
jgi:hypothetical protein